jgi:hypothetical protein
MRPILATSAAGSLGFGEHRAVAGQLNECWQRTGGEARAGLRCGQAGTSGGERRRPEGRFVLGRDAKAVPLQPVGVRAPHVLFSQGGAPPMEKGRWWSGSTLHLRLPMRRESEKAGSLGTHIALPR